ncbi:MAG TPA: hypothetical protein VIY69_10165 [Candidatus Acidoferrales bacterium]
MADVRNKARYRPSTRYFLVLALAGNLFTATGYFLFSGVLNFGDWAAVIHGLQPHWAWQLGLIVVGVLSYYASMLLVASEFGPFKTIEGPHRSRLLCWTPYFTDGVLAFIAGLPNPTGLFYIVASALPSRSAQTRACWYSRRCCAPRNQTMSRTVRFVAASPGLCSRWSPACFTSSWVVASHGRAEAA